MSSRLRVILLGFVFAVAFHATQASAASVAYLLDGPAGGTHRVAAFADYGAALESDTRAGSPIPTGSVREELSGVLSPPLVAALLVAAGLAGLGMRRRTP